MNNNYVYIAVLVPLSVVIILLIQSSNDVKVNLDTHSSILNLLEDGLFDLSKKNAILQTTLSAYFNETQGKIKQLEVHVSRLQEQVLKVESISKEMQEENSGRRLADQLFLKTAADLENRSVLIMEMIVTMEVKTLSGFSHYAWPSLDRFFRSIYEDENRNRPESLSSASSLFTLRSLDLSGLGLTYLPPEIGMLHNLENLDLRLNQLRSLPKELGNLWNLKLFQASRNQISSIPDDFWKLEKLEWLDLGNNQIQEISGQIGRMKALEFLHLSRNFLSELPLEIGNLHRLSYLNLQENKQMATAFLHPDHPIYSQMKNLPSKQNQWINNQSGFFV